MCEDSIRVSIKAFGSLRDLLPPQILLPPCASVRSLLQTVSPAARALLLAGEEPLSLAPGILIFRNGTLIHHLEGLDTPLHDSDELRVFSEHHSRNSPSVRDTAGSDYSPFDFSHNNVPPIEFDDIRHS